MGSPNLVPIPSPDDKLGVVRALRKLASLMLNQDASPTFAALTLTGALTVDSIAVAGDMTVGGGVTIGDLTASRLLFGDGSKIVDSVEDLTAWIDGTTDHISVADDSDGSITIDLGTNTQTLLDSFNGSFLETIALLITEAGGTVTGSLNQEDGGDLIQKFSDGYSTLDTTPALTIDLTAYVGTDSVPKEVFVYILQSAKTVMAASNAGWPATEHIKVANLLLRSAATTGTDNGALVNRNWNDHAQGTNSQGHLLHIAERLRQEVSSWHDGVALTLKNVAGAALTTGNSSTAVELVTTVGSIYQLHKQTFPAHDMYVNANDDTHIVNDSVSPYLTTADLVTDVTAIADGTAIGVNKYFNLVIWGAQNKSGEAQHLLVNLPTGQYTTSANAVSDVDGYSIFSIPNAYRGVGFLIARLTFRLIAGSQWTYIAQEDLRGPVSYTHLTLPTI
ncbi:MAG TPA: hypothetical protein ENI05_00455, partial [Porticoccus sp.]|nr:hypothetical protein [Porticoccus sp.]